MKRIYLIRILVLSIILALFTQTGSAGTVEEGVTTNLCSDSMITFEYGYDGQLIGTVTGVQFTNTDGYDWVIGDFATEAYNGKYPDGAYTSDGDKWAWLGVNQASGRIDFTEGTASYVSLLTSTVSGLAMEAYDEDDNLLDRAPASGVTSSNINTGLMTKLTVNDANGNIAYVIVYDDGNYFLIDDICTDAPGVGDIDIPEFPTVALPIVAILGLMFIIQRRKN